MENHHEIHHDITQKPRHDSAGKAGVPFDLALFGSAFRTTDRIRWAPEALACCWRIFEEKNPDEPCLTCEMVGLTKWKTQILTLFNNV